MPNESIADMALHELWKAEQDAIKYCQQVTDELARREKRINELATDRDLWRERHGRLGTLSVLLVIASLVAGWAARAGAERLTEVLR